MTATDQNAGFLDHWGRVLRGLAAAAVAVAALVAVPTALAQDLSTTDISSAGPLTNIWISNDLSCQVGYSGDDSFEFYPPDETEADCGTFLSYEGTLYGPDFDEHPVSATGFANDEDSYEDLTPGTQTETGNGTAASPYTVTTTVDVDDTDLTLTEVDTYVVGDEYYGTSITVSNPREAAFSATIYHAGDCYLQGSDSGFGNVDPSTDAPACTENPDNSPPGQVEEFSPITSGIDYVETGYGTVWSDVGSQTRLPDTCDCTTDEDNGEGIDWYDINVPGDSSTTVSMLSDFSGSGQLVGEPVVTTGAASAVSQTSATVSGTVNPSGSAVSNCTFEWGTTTAYGQDAPCAQVAGSGNSPVPVSAALSGLAPGTTYHYQLVAENAHGPGYGGDQTFTTPSATGAKPGAPAAVTGPPTVKGSSGAAFGGSVNPDGLATSTYFEYGLDPKYAGGGPVVYDLTTPVVQVGSGSSAQPVAAQVSGLVPNAVYHVRLVARNSAGTTFGADRTFTTQKSAPPGPPVLGKSFDAKLVSGVVLIRLPRGGHVAHASNELSKGIGFIPLTEARQLPTGTQVDARRGTLDLEAASTTKHHTQTGTFSGGLFALSQARTGVHKGLTTLTLREGLFPGAPTYASCSVGKSVRAVGAKLNPKVLQTLKASDHNGKFSTKGRYGAATVRGTVWTMSDQCDGTLTSVKRGVVNVLDFATRATVVLHAGQHFLAQPKRT